MQNEKKKFLFDVNIFDEKEEPTEPPPPMFSEAELASAREQSFAEGKALGVRETEEARAKFVAQVLDRISKDVSILFAAEAAREKKYEQEAVALALAVFQKLYPLYEKENGFKEMKKTLEEILRRQEGQKTISIYVAPDLADGVREGLKHIKVGGEFIVEGDATLAAGSCRLAWSDGGAVRDAPAIAAQVESALKDLLAGNGAKVHDNLKGDAS